MCNTNVVPFFAKKRKKELVGKVMHITYSPFLRHCTLAMTNLGVDIAKVNLYLNFFTWTSCNKLFELGILPPLLHLHRNNYTCTQCTHTHTCNACEQAHVHTLPHVQTVCECVYIHTRYTQERYDIVCAMCMYIKTHAYNVRQHASPDTYTRM